MVKEKRCGSDKIVLRSVVADCAGDALAGCAGDRDFSGADAGWGEKGF